MKEFDFNLALEQGQNEDKIVWLKENQHKTVTEDEFVIAIRNIPHIGTGKSRRSPSRLKKNYKSLVNKFGFFR